METLRGLGSIGRNQNPSVSRPHSFSVVQIRRPIVYRRLGPETEEGVAPWRPSCEGSLLILHLRFAGLYIQRQAKKTRWADLTRFSALGAMSLKILLVVVLRNTESVRSNCCDRRANKLGAILSKGPSTSLSSAKTQVHNTFATLDARA